MKPSIRLIHFSILSLAILYSVIATGCSSFGGRKEFTGVSEEALPPEPMAEAPQMENRALADLAAPAPSLKRAVQPAAGETVLPEDPGAGPAENRRRVYSGSAELVTDRPEERQQEIIDIAEESGGYLETVSGNAVVIRVPAADFETIFGRVLTLGEVRSKSIETYDVTEAFTDLSIRLEVAKRARERYYALLEKTEDVKERIRILKEIKRLNEEIEGIGNTLRLIENSVAFSRISVRLIPLLPEESAQRNRIPFPWIANLNPYSASIHGVNGRVELQLDDDFAVFERAAFFRAESPDGTRIRVGSLPNAPEGSAAFWRKALVYHLKDFYRETDELNAGGLSGVLFTGRGEKAYSYFVGIRVIADTLYVAEAFFPTQESFSRYSKAVFEAFGGMEIRP